MSTLSVSEWTSVISTLCAAIAAIFSAVAIYTAQKAVKDQRAAESVRKYLELALQYPGLSTDKSDRENQKYEWFVSFMLVMVQDVLLAHRGDQGWEKLMEEQLGFHRDMLSDWKQDHPTYFKNFGFDVERLVDNALKTS